jgi:hypothetical protein
LRSDCQTSIIPSWQVLNNLGSRGSRRVYEFALDQFIARYCSEPWLAFNRIVVTRTACISDRGGWQPTRSISEGEHRLRVQYYARWGFQRGGQMFFLAGY